MIARLDGRVILVAGAIPGERVEARIERVGKGVMFAETVAVVTPSTDRREGSRDWRCGGNVYAYVDYARQLQLKAEIVRDAFVRIGRIPLAPVPAVVASPERGYRMRARLHQSGGRIGFFREGSHELCDPAATEQLLPDTCSWIAGLERRLRDENLRGVRSLELAENVPASERACHLELDAGADPAAFSHLGGDGLTGLSAEPADRLGVAQLSGKGWVSDALQAREGDASSTLHLRRSARSFFQGNRYLLERLVRHVIALMPAGPIVDLYAGVGLFGLSLAAAGHSGITVVEGDPVSGADLSDNAAPFADRVRVERSSVESFLHQAPRSGATFVVDPPRTGLSREALAGLVRAEPSAVVYVSCDVATLARDARALLDAGYEMSGVTAFDLFPNTAHIESIATLIRTRG